MVINKYLAELVGTFILVFVGSMSILAAQAIAAAGGPNLVLVVVPFGFGLGLLAAIYAVGHVSGGHFNPAVTLGLFLDGRTNLSDLIGYWIGQVVGGIVASLVVLAAADQAAVAGTYTRHGSTGTGFLMELALTAIFVLVILASTRTAPRAAPVAISLTLAAVHFAGIPFSGSSVNPARSIGPGLVGADAPGLWVYLVAPLAGAIIAWGLHRLFGSEPATAETV